MKNTNFLVRKDQLSTTQLRETEMAPLADGQVRIAIDRFALSSNNITYAAFGDAMDYWRFFPVKKEDGSVDAEWGSIPVWGFGTVQESTHADVKAGEKLYGYFPMATHVDLVPTRLSAQGFSDGAEHRAALHPVYNSYLRCAADTVYSKDTEDLQALLRPLYTTSWLIDDFMADNDFFGAAAHAGKPGLMLLSSASSKTAYGTAHEMMKRAAQANIEVVGLTSARNVAFCESLGCYHRVLRYEQLQEIGADAPAVYIDFAGNAAFRKALHTHCTGLAYSSSIGGTHVAELGGARDLPGPKPTLFFAPAQIKKRSAEWGGAMFAQKLLASWQQFIATVGAPAHPWLQVQHHQGVAGIAAMYAAVLGGQGDPRVGHILAM